jgi:hypothetical protein
MVIYSLFTNSIRFIEQGSKVLQSSNYTMQK